MLAACQGKVEVPRAPDDFIRTLFDGFAAGFDDNLASLGYRVPGLLAERLVPLGASVNGALDVLDAGCGTGLCAHFLRPLASALTGVDLSPGMLQIARGRKAYDALIEEELSRYLEDQRDTFDLILSADTLIYFGDLSAVLKSAAMTLKSGGLLLFSLERLVDVADTEIMLNGAGRYQHEEGYVRRVLQDAGLELRACDHEALRKESGESVPGLIVEARKPATA